MVDFLTWKQRFPGRTVGHLAPLFLLLLISYAYFFPRWADWNQNSHFALVQALVEERRLSIDDYYRSTGDYAIYGGHKYTDKAPGLSILASPVYAGFRVVMRHLPSRVLVGESASNKALRDTLRPNGTGLNASKVDFALALYVVTFFIISVPSALLGVLVFLFLQDLGFTHRVSLFTTLACALGTVAFAYSSVFYSHQLAAFFMFAAFYLLYRVKARRLGRNYLWFVGVVIGVSVLTDFPTVVPSGLLILYAASFVTPRRDLVMVIGGGAPFALILAAYNALCFGSPLSSSYRYLALFPQQRDYGFLGFAAPTWTAFWGITFSPFRGLFFSSPFLLLLGPGLYLAWISRRHRPEVCVSAAVILTYFAFISCYYDWKGGFSIAGPRNLIPLIPFAAVFVASSIRYFWNSTLARATITAALLWSFGATFVQVASARSFAPITIASPLFQYFLPRMMEGDVNRNVGMLLHLSSWSSLAPYVVAVSMIVLVTNAGISDREKVARE